MSKQCYDQRSMKERAGVFKLWTLSSGRISYPVDITRM